MRRMIVSACAWFPLVLVLILVASLRRVSAVYTTTISPGAEECFYVRTPADRPVLISGNFECIDDDVQARDLSVNINNPDNGEIIYDAPKNSREGSFELDQTKLKQGQRYALCIQSNESENDDENAFDVGFSIYVSYLPRTLKDDEIGPDAERALMLVNKATRIHHDWINLMDHYEYVRNREALHQNMNDAILGRLSKWTYIEAFVLISMYTAQVMYWKRFFETRRYL